MRNRKTVGFITMVVGVLLVTLGSAFATHTASGGGTYFVIEGVRSQFQFNPASLQCKVAQAGAPPGLQMFMFSTAIDSFDLDGNEGTITITGQLASTTVTADGDRVAVAMSWCSYTNTTRVAAASSSSRSSHIRS